jgi:hypothetical protein
MPTHSAPGPSLGAGLEPSARRRTVQLVAVLIVVGSVTWRRGEYFSGSLDPVVLAKGAVSMLALALAFGLARSGSRPRLGTGSVWLLALLLGSSVFGAWSSGRLLAGGLVGVRVAVLGATVFFLLRAAPAERVLPAIGWACGGVAAVGSVTGLPSLASGRLAGGIPAMDPNELALLAGIAIAFLAWRAVLGDARWSAALAGGYFLAVVWVTGSRTGLLMLLAGIVVMAIAVTAALSSGLQDAIGSIVDKITGLLS